MTATDHVTAEPLLGSRYTIEEVAVLADLYDLESLPGTPPVELSMELRSLATRSLIARGVVQMPDGGGVEVAQPHATLLAGIFDATVVLQVTWVEPSITHTSTWFALTDDCVRVVVDEGIVDIDALVLTAEEAIDRTLGINVKGTLPAESEAEVVVEITRTDLHAVPAHTTRSVVARVDGTWYSLAAATSEVAK